MGRAAANRTGSDYQPKDFLHQAENPWFSGQALSVFHDLDAEHVAALFGQYLQAQDLRISRAQAEERMLAKLASPGFLSDVRPLLAAEHAEGMTDEMMKAAFADVFTRLVGSLPGDPWARTDAMIERFGIDVSR